MDSFVIFGDICFSEDKNTVITKNDSYLVVKDGICAGVFNSLDEKYREFKFYNFKSKIIIPGLVDLHLHAPQYSFRCLGMDLELLEWLNTYTFPCEAKFYDISIADKLYKNFVEDLKKSATTRACIFATIHVPSTILLMQMLEESKLYTFVGKVNMDRNGNGILQEKDAKTSFENTLKWLDETSNKFENTFPILTPRFTPSVSDELMALLGKIAVEKNLPVQSHLSENLKEIEWVRQLVPSSKNYLDAYMKFGMAGKTRTIMAHCVHSDETEQKMLLENNIFIAHCPNSNINLSSGIAPCKKYLEDGQKIGLGSDVAGGCYLSIFKEMVDAISVSKLRYSIMDRNYSPLTVDEAFYLGTMGGGEFFGKVGSFKEGYEADILVIDPERFSSSEMSLRDKFERMIYMSDDCDILKKFVKGKELY